MDVLPKDQHRVGDPLRSYFDIVVLDDVAHVYQLHKAIALLPGDDASLAQAIEALTLSLGGGMRSAAGLEEATLGDLADEVDQLLDRPLERADVVTTFGILGFQGRQHGLAGQRLADHRRCVQQLLIRVWKGRQTNIDRRAISAQPPELAPLCPPSRLIASHQRAAKNSSSALRA